MSRVMYKPDLKRSILPSTANTCQLLTGTSAKWTDRNSRSNNCISSHNQNEQIYSQLSPIISSFNQASLREISMVNPSIRLQNQSFKTNQSYEQTNINLSTQNIQTMIKKLIDADSERSTQNARLFASENYVLGPELIFTQDPFPIPTPVIEAFNRFQQQNRRDLNNDALPQKIPNFHGYLKGIHSIYWVVAEDLFIFNLDDLRFSRDNGRDIHYRVSLDPQCYGICEVQLNSSLNNLIPSQFSRNTLIFQYPYKIHICAYQFTPANNGQRRINRTLNNNEIQKMNLKMIQYKQNKFSVPSAQANFITLTSNSQLLYLDQKGKLNYVSLLPFNTNIKIKPQSVQERNNNEKKFILRNQTFVKQAKQFVYTLKNAFTHSLSQQIVKNLSLVYDEKRGAVYTLTKKGNRSTILQSINKQIRAYKLNYNKNNVLEIDCVWLIKEEKLLAYINQQLPNSLKAEIQSIQKIEKQYREDIDLAVVLSNGTRAYLQIGLEIKVLRVQRPPNHQVFKKVLVSRHSQFLGACVNQIYGSEQQISRYFLKSYQINPISLEKSSQQSQVKCSINECSQHLCMIRNRQRTQMYLSMKDYKDKNAYKIIPIVFKDRMLDRQCKDNKLYESAPTYLAGLIEKKILQLQRSQRISLSLKGDRKNKQKIPVANAHEYLRQVYCSIRVFTYMTNSHTTSFMLLRPIDILCHLVNQLNYQFCQKFIQPILNIDEIQICSMLLQLYSNRQNVYYIQNHQKLKIDKIIQIIQKSQTKFSLNKQKSKFLQHNAREQYQQQLEKYFDFQQVSNKLLVFKCSQTPQATKKILKLFVHFSQYHSKNSNDSNFQQVELRQSVEQQMVFPLFNQAQTKERRSQFQCVMVYVSRVLYPIWRCEFKELQAKQYIVQVKKKMIELKKTVKLLEEVNNGYSKSLSMFIDKVLQILEILNQISYVPEDMTMEEAVTKSSDFFQQYIFLNMNRQTSPEMINTYERIFPSYITQQFKTLIRIYNVVSNTSDHQQIRTALTRLPTYPQYFIKYIQIQKPFYPYTAQIRARNVFQVRCIDSYSKVFVPSHLNFESSINYIFNQVQNQKTSLQLKESYLRQADQRLKQYTSTKRFNGERQKVDSRVVQELETRRQQLYLQLKLQIECQQSFVHYIEQQIQKEKRKKQLGGRSFLQKLGDVLQETIFSQQSPEDKYEKFLHFRQLSDEQNRSIQESFRKLQKVIIPINEMQNLIQLLNSPDLNIYYALFFPSKDIQQKTHNNQIRLNLLYNFLLQNFIKLIEVFQQKASVTNDTTQVYKIECQQFQSFIDILRKQIKRIYLFLNYKKGADKLYFKSLYDAVKKQMLAFKQYQELIMMENPSHTKQKYLYRIARDLVNEGFNKNIIIETLQEKLYFFADNLKQNVNPANLNISSNSLQSGDGWDHHNRQKLAQLIYDCNMLYDLLKAYPNKKASQNLVKILQVLIFQSKNVLEDDLWNESEYQKENQFMKDKKNKLVKLINNESGKNIENAFNLLRNKQSAQQIFKLSRGRIQ